MNPILQFLLGLALLQPYSWQIPIGGITGVAASGGTVALNNAGTPVFVNAATYSGSFSVTAGGTHTCAFAYATFSTAGSPSMTMTYNSASMTSAGAIQLSVSGAIGIQWFYLVAPATGSNILAITGTNMTLGYVNLISFNHCNQSTPVRAGTFNGTNGSGSATASLTIISNANDLTVSAIDTGSSSTGITSTNQTSDGIDNSGARAAGSDHATTGASSITSTWTLTNTSGNWPIAGFSIQHD